MASSSRDSGDPASQDSAHFDGNDPYALVDDDEITTESAGLLGPPSNGASSGTGANGYWAGFDDFAGLPWYKVPSVYWLVPPYFLFAMAFGGSIVPKLNLIIDLVCNKYFDDRAALDPNFTFTPVVLLGENPQCQIPEVQKAVAKFTLVLNVIIGTLSALTAPKFGSLSDRYGRKRLLVIASVGGVIAEVVTILAARFPETIPYKWMLAGAVFDGLSGSFTTGTVLSHSYTSDCTPPSKRSVAIGYLQACLFSGLAFGPLLAAYFIRWTGSILSIFYVTLGCHLLFIFFVLLVTPESLSQKRQKLAREKHAEEQAANREVGWFARLMGGNANPLEPLRILAPRGPEHKALRRNFLAFAVCDFIILGCALAAGGVILLYSELTFGWGNFETSRFISLVSGVRVLVLMVFFPIISWWFRTRPMKLRREKAAAALQAQLQAQSRQANGSGEAEPLVQANHHDALQLETNTGADNLDVWLLRLALLSDILGTVGYLFVRTPTFFVATAIVTAFGGIASATIQSSLTKHVPAQSVGQLLGAMGVLHAIARVIAPILFNGLYAATVKTFPQAFFVLLVSLFVLAGVASLFVKPHVYMKEDQDSAPQRSSSPSFHPAAPTIETLDDEELLPA